MDNIAKTYNGLVPYDVAAIYNASLGYDSYLYDAIFSYDGDAELPPEETQPSGIGPRKQDAKKQSAPNNTINASDFVRPKPKKKQAIATTSPIVLPPELITFPAIAAEYQSKTVDILATARNVDYSKAIAEIAAVESVEIEIPAVEQAIAQQEDPQSPIDEPVETTGLSIEPAQAAQVAAMPEAKPLVFYDDDAEAMALIMMMIESDA